LNRQTKSETRSELESKLAKVFSKEINELSKEFQTALIDDLVTAFEKRIKVFAYTKTGV
jgi:hypothetical protein